MAKSLHFFQMNSMGTLDCANIQQSRNTLALLNSEFVGRKHCGSKDLNKVTGFVQ